jgi:hypothetical protein
VTKIIIEFDEKVPGELVEEIMDKLNERWETHNLFTELFFFEFKPTGNLPLPRIYLEKEN